MVPETAPKEKAKALRHLYQNISNVLAQQISEQLTPFNYHGLRIAQPRESQRNNNEYWAAHFAVFYKKNPSLFLAQMFIGSLYIYALFLENQAILSHAYAAYTHLFYFIIFVINYICLVLHTTLQMFEEPYRKKFYKYTLEVIARHNQYVRTDEAQVLYLQQMMQDSHDINQISCSDLISFANFVMTGGYIFFAGKQFVIPIIYIGIHYMLMAYLLLDQRPRLYEQKIFDALNMCLNSCKNNSGKLPVWLSPLYSLYGVDSGLLMGIENINTKEKLAANAKFSMYECTQYLNHITLNPSFYTSLDESAFSLIKEILKALSESSIHLDISSESDMGETLVRSTSMLIQYCKTKDAISCAFDECDIQHTRHSITHQCISNLRSKLLFMKSIDSSSQGNINNQDNSYQPIPRLEMV